MESGSELSSISSESVRRNEFVIHYRGGFCQFIKETSFFPSGFEAGIWHITTVSLRNIRQESLMNHLLNTQIHFETHSFFRGLKPEHLEIIQTGATQEIVESGQVLFHQGSPANSLFLIEKGSVALESIVPGRQPVLIQVLPAGELLGWSWLFPPFIWHFQARALERTELVVMNGGHLLVAAEQDHDFGYALIKRVAQVVIERLQTTRNNLV
jgi:CRP/FNR family cyclic AMP-dependent transcriptional regulator